MISVILVSYNDSLEVNRLITALFSEVEKSSVLKKETMEIIVSDNSTDQLFSLDSASGHKSAEMVPHIPVKVLKSLGNRGFASGAHRGSKVAAGDWLWFLNSDISFEPGVLSSFFAAVADRCVDGVYAPLLVEGSAAKNLEGSAAGNTKFPRTGLSSSGGCFHFRLQRALRKVMKSESACHLTVDSSGATFSQVDWVAGTSMLLRKDTYLSAGGFSPSYFMYFEDVDLCSRLKEQGISAWLYHSSCIVHHKSRDEVDLSRKCNYRNSRNIFFRRRAGTLFNAFLPFLDLLERTFVV